MRNIPMFRCKNTFLCIFMAITIDEDYKNLTPEEKVLLHKHFNEIATEEEFLEKYNELKKVIFKVPPPSGREFLNYENGFLSYHVENALYDYIKEDFIKIVDRQVDPYSIISLYGSIRTGKSTLVRLLVVYCIVFINYIRDPHLYFKTSGMNILTIYLLSFDDKKTNEVLLDPLLKIIRNSPKFQKETFEENVYKRGVREDGIIHYSTASKFGDLTFPNCSIVTGRDPSDTIGADILVGAITEITFYRRYMGITDEQVTDVYAKLKTRIKNTVGMGIFPCFTILDSSAYDADSDIEKLIENVIKVDKNNFYAYYRLWEKRPYLFSKYNSDNSQTFKVCTGNATYPAKIIRNNWEIKDIPDNLIVDVPIDLKDDFELKLVDSIRDLVGIGTTNTAKFINSTKLIDSIFDNPTLENFNSRIIVDSCEIPENLIWRKLPIDKIFIKNFNSEYEIIRAPKEARFIGKDLSFSHQGDDTGFAVIHKEYSREKRSIIYVCDFCLVIGAGENKINMDAVSEFDIDLANLGHMSILGISLDTFQSESTVQKLERWKFNVENNSMDRTPEAYEMFGSIILQGLFKAGEHKYLWNNLNSLYREEKSNGRIKIDHSKSSTPLEGKDAKDVSDAVCQAIWIASQSRSYPSTIYEDENERLLKLENEEVSQEKINAVMKRFR